jgi:hypothetical protein
VTQPNGCRDLGPGAALIPQRHDALLPVTVLAISMAHRLQGSCWDMRSFICCI